MIAALGVTFGDIGTSPLYALRECFNPSHNIAPTTENIYGVLSLIFWTMTLIVTVKYMIFVLRADNNGEGGILSLMALIQGATGRFYVEKFFFPLGLMGAALLVGDGFITPAISVLSAVEGLAVAAPEVEHWVMPITIIILFGLFFIQSRGTGTIGRLFGPVIVVWMLVMGGLGIYGICQNPQIIRSLNPYYAWKFFQEHGAGLVVILGSVFLVVTGGEALYADMGHFGKRPIRLGWFYFVFPALVLNYLGQGAIVLNDNEKIASPFFKLAPEGWVIPLVILSTLATVIASQALISGVFSICKQAVQLGFYPRIQIKHTSREEIGQIYVPVVNWVLLAGVIWLVVTFKTSSNLASAYGIAVSMNMAITTLLAATVARIIWKWRLWKVITFALGFLVIDFVFVFSCLTKLFEGAWIPLIICAGIFLLMSTWKRGREILSNYLIERSVSLEEFVRNITVEPPKRVPGAAIYMTGDPFGVPLPLLQNMKHFKVLHEKIAVLTIATEQVPFVKRDGGLLIRELAPNFYRVFAIYGFMETPKIREILDLCQAQGVEFKIEDTTFVLGRETILAKGMRGMSAWREKIFAVMARNAQRPTAFFGIPASSVIEVGIQIEI